MNTIDLTDEIVIKKIQTILNKNKLDDLQKFLEQRSQLNYYNSYLIYLFHILQCAGILTTTIAAGYNKKELVWTGVGLNILASLLNIFEKTNNSISKKILADIIKIKNNNYVDESLLIDSNEEQYKMRIIDKYSHIEHEEMMNNKLTDLSNINV